MRSGLVSLRELWHCLQTWTEFAESTVPTCVPGSERRTLREARSPATPRSRTPAITGKIPRACRAVVRSMNLRDPLFKPSSLPASELTVIYRALFGEGGDPLLHLRGAGVNCEPVPGVPDGYAPGEISPEIELLFGVPRAFGELFDKRMGHLIDGGIQVLPRDDAVEKAPFQRLCGADRFAEKEHLARSPVSDDHRQPLRGPRSGDAAARYPHMTDESIIGRDGEVAGDLQLIPPADDHAVDAGNRGFSKRPEAFKSLDKDSHPLVEVRGALREIFTPFLDIRAGAERPGYRARKDNHRDVVVPCCILEGDPQFGQRPEIERVEDLRPIDRDRRPKTGLLVENFLKAERPGGFPGVAAQSSTSPKNTVTIPAAKDIRSFTSARPSGEAFDALRASMES